MNYDEAIPVEATVELSEAEKMARIFDERIALALAQMQATKAPPVNEQKQKTVLVLQELVRKVQADEVTGLAFVSVGPNPHPGYGYSENATGLGALVGELEVIKGRMVGAIIAPQQQQPA